MKEKETEYKKMKRKFVPEKISWESFSDLEKLYKSLQDRDINSRESLEKLICDLNEIKKVFYEKRNRAYINMTSHTNNKKMQAEYIHFITKIEPKAKEYIFKIHEKILKNNKKYPLISSKYNIYIRHLKNHFKLFRKKNIELEKQEEKLANEYSKIMGNMMFSFRGENYTTQQIYKFLEERDRDLRKEAYNVFWKESKKEINKIYNVFQKQIKIRNKIAKNADFKNYRDYKFEELERFYYTPRDCFLFHENIRKNILPFVNKIMERRKKALRINHLKPWDLHVDIYGKEPLHPFSDAEELLSKTIEIFKRVHPELGKKVTLMKKKRMLDLESREGKAPGGYMTNLSEIQLPFIFMNAVGTHRDALTLLHESGHAFHSFSYSKQPLEEYHDAPSEICEVASMSMELITMDYWDIFYNKKEDLLRAKIRQLESIITLFPWISIIDLFQHWLYTEESSNRSSLINKWKSLIDAFHSYIDYKGSNFSYSYTWIRQLHLFEVPFYYIEYAFAQLGAIQLWVNYKKNPQITINQYMDGLSLGGSRPLPELYKAIGIKFDFSEKMLKKLLNEVNKELESFLKELNEIKNANN
ncbi:M3 family oligoendopeptidase [candidate division WOR-3 bacterium]|nr:M3 family oligoendopeptidase [candidate division WOR-3 bacterium]